MSKDKSLRDRRKPFFEPENINRGFQVEVYHEHQKEQTRKVKESRPGKLMEKSKQGKAINNYSMHGYNKILSAFGDLTHLKLNLLIEILY